MSEPEEHDDCHVCNGEGAVECECIECGDLHDRQCSHCDGTGLEPAAQGADAGGKERP